MPRIFSKRQKLPKNLKIIPERLQHEIILPIPEQISRYTIPAGETKGPGNCNLEDSSYDGKNVNGTLTQGLGQLTDNVLGDGFEILQSGNANSWVGWSNRENVEMIFEFKEVREFDNCSVYVAHIPRREVEVRLTFFGSMKLNFTHNGKKKKFELIASQLHVRFKEKVKWVFSRLARIDTERSRDSLKF